MGRRATRRRHKKKYNKRQGCYSDPEELHQSQNGGIRRDTRVSTRREKWESLDDLALIDYATNAASNDAVTIHDEMEVTRRLSSLNVSAACCSNDLNVMTSDVETIYSEFPPSATLADNLPGEFLPLERLKERQCRKRSSKRNRKRTKKIKALILPPGISEETMAVPVGRNRKPSQISKLRFNPIDWVHSTGEPSHVNPLPSYLKEGEEERLKDHYSDASSRALTDSDESPILDDIIMVDSGPEETGLGVVHMEGSTLEPQTTPPLNSQSISILHPNSEEELTESSSSGCEGDDEESSAEVTGSSLKTGGGTNISSTLRRSSKLLHSRRPGADKGFSSTEEILEDGSSTTSRVPKGNVPSGQDGQNWITPSISGCGEFKHPQHWGIKGGVNSFTQKKKKKLIPPITCTSLQDLSNKIRDFVQFSVDLEMNLPMMSRALCRTASNLADLYNLECVVYQKRRLPVASPMLRKTCCTRLASESEIEVVLKNHRQEVINSVLSPKKHRRVTLPVHVPVSVLTNNVQRKLVGGDAPPIGEGNVGNRLLQGMGWKPGNGLGRQENGIQDPLFAEMRPKTAGLGYA